ncbi:MAG: hypothetical protein H0U27_02875 [Nitrosopumilus sp.]|nr:hypothetical protein [Nitrosopumilus sp.]
MYGQVSGKIKDKIKSKTVWKITINQDSTLKDSLKTKMYFYNKKGRVIRETEYKGDGSVYYSAKIEHEGTVLSKGLKTKYQYNNTGLKISETIYSKDSSTLIFTTFVYDSKNNIIEQVSENKGSSIFRKNYFKYDDQNNIIEEVFFVNNFKKGINFHRYNKLNYKIESKYFTLYDDAITLTKVIHYTYEYW